MNDAKTTSLDRRGFARAAGGTLLGALSGGSATTEARHASPTPARPRVLMKVGTQHGSSDEILTVLAALGVNNICSDLPSTRLDEKWSVEALRKLRERVESFGIPLDMVPLPLSSHPIAARRVPEHHACPEPERERDIDDIQPDDPQHGAGGHPGAQVQHDVPGRRAHGAHEGRGRRAIQHVLLREGAPGAAADGRGAGAAPTSTGSGSPTSSIASSRWPRSTRCAWPAIRTTRACRRAGATGAWTRCWAASRA